MNGGYYDSRPGLPVASSSDDKYSAGYSAPANEGKHFKMLAISRFFV